MKYQLKHGTSADQRRVIPWGPLAIAASILLVIGAGIWFFSAPGQPFIAAQTARTPAEKKSARPVISAPSALSAAGEQESAAQSNPGPPAARQNQAPVYRDSADIAPALIAAANQPLPVPAITAPAAEPAPQPIELLYKPRKDSVGANELIVSGMGRKTGQSDSATGEALPEGEAADLAATPGNRTLRGMVIGYQGQPLTGATVKISGRTFAMITDAAGKFTVSEVPAGQTLWVNSIGYHPKKVKLGSEDSLIIHLEPTDSMLSEAAAVTNEQGNAADPQPKDGWSTYQQYLKKNAVSPDAATGKVVLTFLVGADGRTSEIRVSHSLSEAADNKAIDLVKNGPAWSAAGDGKPREINVSVHFHR